MLEFAKPDHLLQCITNVRECCNLLLHNVQLVQGKIMGQTACLWSVERQQSGDVFKTESKRLSSLNKADAAHVGLTVFPVSRGRPFRFGK